MRWYFTVFLIFLTINVYAFRIPRPPVFSLPWTEDQINQLNDTLENVWNLQNGEFNLDIVTTTKSSADNGDFWLIQTGSVAYIQYKHGGHIFTVNL